MIVSVRSIGNVRTRNKSAISVLEDAKMAALTWGPMAYDLFPIPIIRVKGSCVLNQVWFCPRRYCQALTTSAHMLDDMKIVLVRMQLLGCHILNSEGVVDCIGDDNVAVAVIVGSRQQRVDICKYRMSEIYAG